MGEIYSGECPIGMEQGADGFCYYPDNKNWGWDTDGLTAPPDAAI